MATSPQVQGQGAIWSGLATTGTYPEQLLKRGMDRLGAMAFMTRGMTSLLHMLHARFGAAKTVNTREFPVYELSELDRIYNVTVASNDPGGNARPDNTFGLSNAQASQIQANDILFHRNLFCFVQTLPLQAGQVYAGGGANIGPDLDWTTGGNPTGVVFSRTFGVDAAGNGFVANEPMHVLSVGAPDSAGVGNTLITVRRVFKGPAAKDMGGAFVGSTVIDAGIRANAADARIAVGDVLLRGLPAWQEGTGAPTGLHKNPEIDRNFTQEFKYAVEQTNESTIEGIWTEKKPLDINRMLMMRRASLDIERQYLMSCKGVGKDSMGRVTYTMGGIIEFIAQDRDHLLNYKNPSITWPGLLDLGKEIFILGGGSRRTCFTGYTLHTELRKAFYDSGYMRYDPEASKAFNMDVETIHTTGGTLEIIPLYNMEEIGWGNRMLCLDLTLPSFVPVTHKDWDMKTEKDIQEKGTQIYKEQVIGIKGLQRRYQDYHCVVNFDL